MGSKIGQAKRLESAVSILILVVLVVIGVGVFIKQFDSDMARFGIVVSGAGPSSQKAGADERAEEVLNAAIPAGFEAFSEIEVYASDNLYEKINGKAPFYLDCGFKKLLTRRLADKDDADLIMEVYLYDMGGPRGAYSVYSVQRRPQGKSLPGFEFGYRTDNAIYFAHGKYYVELIGFSESDKLVDAMTEAGKKIQAGLAIEDTEAIAELELLKDRDLVEGSIKFYMASAFGFEGLSDVFVGRFKSGDQTVTVFVSKKADPGEAQKVAQSYYDFLIENGGVKKTALNKILKGRVIDFYDTTEIVFSTGIFVGGIHEAEDQRAAEKLAVRLIKKLSDMANND